jgi:peptidoglycan hydrolase-like protein with peptidoglycan-binding domain
MRLCHSSIPIFTCFICLGLYQSLANPAIPKLNTKILQLAQASPTVNAKQPILKPNSKGQDVQALQTQLKQLGYYKGAVDGQYSKNTQIAVAEFQKAKGLVADGIAGEETKERLQTALVAKIPLIPSPSPTSKPSSQGKPSQGNFIWWSLLGLGLLGSIGVIIYLMRRFGQNKKVQQLQLSDAETETEANKNAVNQPSAELNTTPNPEQNVSDVDINQPLTASIFTKLLPSEQTSRLVKLSIVDELIKDLYSSDPHLRRKAIWDLGQQGDSRAIQPLLDLMIDVDSQQRSLILAAVGEIGTRTLKPMNRALAISMQDESPEVRQNAIRDLTRVYDMMSQISQILRHALEDPDAEVQSTAKYALNQMNRIRTVPEQQSSSEDLHNGQ